MTTRLASRRRECVAQFCTPSDPAARGASRAANRDPYLVRIAARGGAPRGIARTVASTYRHTWNVATVDAASRAVDPRAYRRRLRARCTTRMQLRQRRRTSSKRVEM
jgi:hypothetical protein